MEELKVIFASNLIRLRTEAGLTQVELAEKLNYSDKSVSKWERGDALPDVLVVKHIAEIFGVTVDFLLTTHDQWQPNPPKEQISTGTITAIVMMGIVTVAVMLFVIFWLMDKLYWVILVAAIPALLVTLLVLNNVWKRRRWNMLIVSLLVVSVLLLLYMVMAPHHPWQLFLLAVPAVVIVWLSFRIRSKRKNRREKGE